jgi:transposase
MREVAARIRSAHQRSRYRANTGHADHAGGGHERFAAVGNFASYARCVDSARLSNGKKKGQGNVKNGNAYLAWAFVEAANFARRYCAEARRFYERKKARTNGVVATKALAHKLARACYHMLKEQKPFDVKRCSA